MEESGYDVLKWEAFWTEGREGTGATRTPGQSSVDFEMKF
jgi:hypothetical protein